jgi:hypothetical protein
MTGDDIKAEFFENMRIDSNTDYDTQILRQINRALDIIATEPLATIAETAVSLTASTRVYAMPAGVTSIKDCYISGYPTGLRRINPHEAYAFSQTTITGLPQFFWEDNENICVHPMPDQAYTLYVMATGAIDHPTALSDTINLRNAIVGPPAIAATALAPAYCIAIPEFVTWRILGKEKGDYADVAAEAKANWGDLLKKAWDLDRARFARRFSGPIRRDANDLSWANGYWIK